MRLIGILAACLGLAAVLVFWRARPAEGRTVVVYTSVDDEYALPLFERFEKESGLRVVSRTDAENAKTTGMAQRLLAMKGQPDGDVFWNSEHALTQGLADAGVFEPYAAPQGATIPPQFRDPDARWHGFGCRVRVILYNTTQVKAEDAPRSLEDLAQPRWKNRFAVAKPTFGTTQSHLAALCVALGEDEAFKLFRAWRANGVVLAESNGDVRDRVAGGQVAVGLTDSDDAFSALDRQKPVDFIVAGQAGTWTGAFMIPNTVAILKNAPHPAAARAFVDFLLRPDTEKWLAEQGARQVPVREVGATVSTKLKGLTPAIVDGAKLAREVPRLREKIYRVLSGEEP